MYILIVYPPFPVVKRIICAPDVRHETGRFPMKKPFLEGGQIVNTHGIKGEVKLVSWCDSPEVLCAVPV